jgi:hypothetical protein
MSGLYAPKGANNDRDQGPDPLYSTTSLEEEEQLAQNQFKASLSDLQKQSLDRSHENRYLAKQGTSGTNLPQVRHESSTAKTWLRNRDAAAQANQPAPAEDKKPEAQPAVQHSQVDAKVLKKTCEGKGRFEAFVDAITAPFQKKDKSE